MNAGCEAQAAWRDHVPGGLDVMPLSLKLTMKVSPGRWDEMKADFQYVLEW
jgi:hypothetical protein